MNIKRVAENTHIRFGFVEDTPEDLVEDHLRQLELDRLPPLPDLLCDALYLKYGLTMRRRFCSSSVSRHHFPDASLRMFGGAR